MLFMLFRTLFFLLYLDEHLLMYVISTFTGLSKRLDNLVYIHSGLIFSVLNKVEARYLLSIYLIKYFIACIHGIGIFCRTIIT